MDDVIDEVVEESESGAIETTPGVDAGVDIDGKVGACGSPSMIFNENANKSYEKIIGPAGYAKCLSNHTLNIWTKLPVNIKDDVYTSLVCDEC